MDNSGERLVTAEQKSDISREILPVKEAIPNESFDVVCSEKGKDQSSIKPKNSRESRVDFEVDTDELRWFHKLVWFLYELTWSGSLVATILYWVAINQNSKISDNPYDLYQHGLNCIMLFADTILARLPTLLLHAVQHGCVFFIYLVFTVIVYLIRYANYEESDTMQLYIYKPLDWINLPLNGVLTICLVFPVAFACQAFLVGLQVLKIIIYQKLQNASP